MADFKTSELRAWRNEHDISQEKFAKLAELGINTIAKIESGATQQVQPQTYDKLIKAMAKVESGAYSSVKAEQAEAYMSNFDPEELRAWRKKHGISQEKLAQMAQLGVNTVLKLEQGIKVQKSTIVKLMNAIKGANKTFKGATEMPLAAKSAGMVEAIPEPAPKAAPEVPAGQGFSLSKLKSWRKAHGLTQGKLAAKAGLSLNTVMKIEGGETGVQQRTMDRLSKAIKEIEGSSKPLTITPQLAVSVVETAPEAPTTPRFEPVVPPVDVTTGVIRLSNLDLELINRIIQMSAKEKLKILESLI